MVYILSKKKIKNKDVLLLQLRYVVVILRVVGNEADAKGDKMQTTTRYMIAVLSDDGRYTIRDCGHKHTTLTGAVRCHNNLTRAMGDGMYDANWWRCRILHADETGLTDAETSAVDSIQYDIERARHKYA